MQVARGRSDGRQHEEDDFISQLRERHPIRPDCAYTRWRVWLWQRSTIVIGSPVISVVLLTRIVPSLMAVNALLAKPVEWIKYIKSELTTDVGVYSVKLKQMS